MFGKWGIYQPSDFPGGEWILEICTHYDGSYAWNDNLPDRPSDDGYVVEFSGFIPTDGQSWSSLKLVY